MHCRLSKATALSVLLCCGLLLSWPLSAVADSYLGCMERSRGRVLTWSANWGDDRADDGVEYEVTAMNVKNKIPDRIVSLELKAVGRANRIARSIKADSEEAARRVCDRLHEKVKPLKFKEEKPEAEFIKFTSEGWVRADLPNNQRLAECVIGGVVFYCIEEEKTRYGTALKNLEAQLKWLER